VSKIAVLGLDGFNPELVKLWLDELPSLKRLQQEGVWGNIESTIPPTAYPAWTCAQTGRNPGMIGFWDATYRDDFSYGEPKVANSQIIKPEPLYRSLPKRGEKVAVINVPVTWPPPEIPGGYCISGFTTPDLESGFTWPDSLKHEVFNVTGEYILDVGEGGVDYRLMNRDAALKRIYDMDTQRFTLLKHFIHKKQCDYILTVLTGTNRMAHLFYRYFDENHRRYEPDSRYKNALHDYYIWIDRNIGEVREALDSDTVPLIHSAYSAQRLDGQINLNEWLIQEGYMTLNEYPPQPTAFRDLKVDWSKTKCWATGYTGQIYLNLKGREAQGIVAPEDYDRLLDELAAKIRGIPDEQGKQLNTQVFKRNDIHSGTYSQYGPDMFISFDQYRRNTSEMAGYGSGNIYSFDTPEGPDDAVNSRYGYFCTAGAGIPAGGELKGISLLSIAPTVLDILQLSIPNDMEKPSILAGIKEAPPKPAEAESRMSARLKALGY